LSKKERNNRNGIDVKATICCSVEKISSEKNQLFFLQGGVCLMLTNTLMGILNWSLFLEITMSRKGESSKVDPIKKMKDIKAIKSQLKSKPRDLALFTVGINTNLRASDLCRITVGIVKNLNPGDDFLLTEKKTGKARRITLNSACIKAIQSLIAASELKDIDQLFKGKRGDIKTTTIIYLVKQWTGAINLKGNYGSHSLRKTWGYHQRKKYGVDIPTLMVMFNHSSQKQTLDYLCVQPQEIKDVYMNEL
jgi:integrase